MAFEEAQNLHLLRRFDKEFLVSFEGVNLCWIAARELAHRLDALPIGDRHELGFGLAVLAERLNAERLFDERLDANVVIVYFVLVGAIAWSSPAPDPNNGR